MKPHKRRYRIRWKRIRHPPTPLLRGRQGEEGLLGVEGEGVGCWEGRGREREGDDGG